MVNQIPASKRRAIFIHPAGMRTLAGLKAMLRLTASRVIRIQRTTHAHRKTMKACIKNRSLLPALIAGLGLILATRLAAQTFTKDVSQLSCCAG